MDYREKIRNIGIFAHVDAGKTTLTEQFLAHAGAIRSIGSVDSGTAHTDRLDVERRRGISVRSTCATLNWKGATLNLIDTPGHADFASEVERSMWALDSAVLLLSAVDGVQPQAEILFRALKRARIPLLIFINKTDREGADVRRALNMARGSLSPSVVDFSSDEQLHVCLAETDEQALSDYVSGGIYPRDTLLAALRKLVRNCAAYPALSGSALRGDGVFTLLDAMVDFLPPPPGEESADAAGIVFAVTEDKLLGRCAHVRMASGVIKNRTPVTLSENTESSAGMPVELKITQIRTIPIEGRGEDIGVLRAGELGAVYGLSGVCVGQVLGNEALIARKPRPGELSSPLLMVKTSPENPEDGRALRAALDVLSAEDPLISAEELGGEMHIRVMGKVQLEVLKDMFESRFGFKIEFGEPNVIYRETISKSAVGFFAYTMPKPCWAVVKFQIDPLPRGSGVVFESTVPARDIMPRYQHQIEQAIPLATRQGMLGWQVDDVKITLIGGEHHLIHTHPLDFILATPVAFMDGLARGGSVLLEPILDMELTVPEDVGGRILSEIVAMRGAALDSRAGGGLLTLSTEVPLKTSVDFQPRFMAITGGRGAMSVKLAGFRECALEEGATCPRKTVHPLDTAKYILAARSALDGGIWG